MNFFSRIFSGRKATPEAVSFDDQRVLRVRTDGKKESLRWDALEEVSIVTTDRGPFMEDLHWVLLGKPGGCTISHSAEGADELLARLQQLPGFDNGAVIQAMKSTDNARFVCWKRAARA